MLREPLVNSARCLVAVNENCDLLYDSKVWGIVQSAYVQYVLSTYNLTMLKPFSLSLEKVNTISMVGETSLQCLQEAGAPGLDTDGVLLSHTASTTFSVLLYSSSGNDYMNALRDKISRQLAFFLQTRCRAIFSWKGSTRHGLVHCAKSLRQQIGSALLFSLVSIGGEAPVRN